MKCVVNYEMSTIDVMSFYISSEFFIKKKVI